MIKKLKVSLLLIVFSTQAIVQANTQWVAIGEGTYNQGFVYPYKVKFYVPYGVRNIKDIKLGLYSMKFNINWLMMESSKRQVEKIINQQLKTNFESVEGYKLYKHVISDFLKSLPSVSKHDEWNFIYNPDEGMRLYIGGQIIHHLVGTELNKALINSWLQKDPVLSSNLFNRLLKVQK